MKKANSKAKKGTQADSKISTAADKTSSRSDNECSKSGAKLNANERNNRKDVPKVTSDRDLIECCFKCTLCSHLLNQPVSLACGHVFCSKCLSGYRDPAESSLKCPQCQVVHDLNAGSSLDSATGSTVKGLSAVTTPVHALADFLKQLTLNSGSAQSTAVCLKHTTATQESPQCANECGIVNWKVNLRRSQLSSGSDANDDRLPYSYEMSLSSDVFTWKNGYPVESGVCLAEGLRWTLAVVPSRGDDERRNIEKPTNFSVAIFCKGWADKTCNKALTKAVKLNVWVTVNNLNDCSLSYNSGPRVCRFDHLNDPRKRSTVVVANVMHLNKLRNLSEGWIQQNLVNIVCKFKVPKKVIKLNVQIPKPPASRMAGSANSEKQM